MKKFSKFLTINNIGKMIETFEGYVDYMVGIVKVEDLLKDVDKYGLLYEPEDESERILDYKNKIQKKQ